MKNIISYDEFISEDYRDVAGCGSGGKHSDDNTTILANGSGSSIIDVIGHPTGDKKVLGTELIKNVKGEYWRQKRDKSKRETNIEEEKKKRMRRKAYKALSDVDTIAENLYEKINVVRYVDWENLSNDERVDMVENIYHNCEFFRKPEFKILENNKLIGFKKNPNYKEYNDMFYNKDGFVYRITRGNDGKLWGLDLYKKEYRSCIGTIQVSYGTDDKEVMKITNGEPIVTNISVDEWNRNEGIAKILYNELINQLKSDGYKKLFSSTTRNSKFVTNIWNKIKTETIKLSNDKKIDYIKLNE